MTTEAPTTQAPIGRQIAETLIDGFDRHYRLFRATSAAAKDRFDEADWAGIQRAMRERIRFYDDRVAESVAPAARRLPRDVARRRDLAGGKAPLHRAARRPQAAGTRRDVLQLGRPARARQHLLAQRLHLRPRGGLDGVHRVRPADLPQLLPAGARPAGDAPSRSSATSAGRDRSPTSTATSTA